MEFLQSVLGVLDTRMTPPGFLGAVHVFSIINLVAAIMVLILLYKKEIIQDVNKVLIVTAVVLAIFEVYRQINFIFGDGTTITYDPSYIPIRFNTLLLYMGIIAGLTKGKFHDNLTSFLATYMLFIGTAITLNPTSVFTDKIGQNICTIVSYGAMVLVGVFLLYTGEVKIKFTTFLKALPIFLMVWFLSTTINVIPHLIFSRFGEVFGYNLLASCPICTNNYSGLSWLHNFIVGSNHTILSYVMYSVVYSMVFTTAALLLVLVLIAVKKLFTTDFDAEYDENDEIAKEIRKTEGLDGDDDENNNGIFKFTGKVNSKKNTYLQTYYENLKVNFGNNVADSCGYVAVAMLLSYYDTILHDKIVPRQFDEPSLSHDEPDFENSPGIKPFYHPEFYPENSESQITYARYKEIVNKNKNKYLHEALIAIGMKKRISKSPEDKLTTDFSFGTDNEKREKLIKYYLKRVAGVKKSEYDIHSVDNFDEIAKAKSEAEVLKYSEEVREYTIKKIKKGYPVLISICGASGGHAVIAYDYDKETDEIFCHMGSDAETTHVTPEQFGYTIYRSAMVLEFDENKIAHSHTSNYEVVINGAIFYYCPDGTYTTCDDIIVEFDRHKLTCAIVGIYGQYYKTKLDIPEKFGNVRVAKIHRRAFANQKHLTEVSLPSTIRVIERGLFKNNRNLQTIIIPGTVERIRRNAFKHCRKLDSIMYLGKTNEWRRIKTRYHWDHGTGNYRVSCTNGFYIKRVLGRDLEIGNAPILGVTKKKHLT